jgi:hypothetical protein
VTLWATVKKEVKGRKIMDKFAPELGIYRGGGGKEI